MALKLKRRGISRVYPMIGGMEAWMEKGYATDTYTTENPATEKHASESDS